MMALALRRFFLLQSKVLTQFGLYLEKHLPLNDITLKGKKHNRKYRRVCKKVKEKYFIEIDLGHRYFWG